MFSAISSVHSLVCKQVVCRCSKTSLVMLVACVLGILLWRALSGSPYRQIARPLYQSALVGVQEMEPDGVEAVILLCGET